MGSPTAPPRSASAHPDRIGRYRITGELGRGGMGVVYRAEDERLGRAVALKVLPAHLGADPRARERLTVEARAAAALDHPNVCTVYEVGDDEGRPFIAFACYEGETLRDRLGAGPLPVPEAVRIAREVAAGVGAAHAADIVHRDLKPSNVFLCADGTAKVLDFGIARLRDVVLTEAGETPGTVEYGAPETAHGRGDARTDVWSLGVVLYEMLTGRRPFAGDYPAAILYAVLHDEPAPPSALRADVPPDVDAVVARCLAKDPADRYPDAGAVAEALGAEAERDVAPYAEVRRAVRAVGRRVRRSRAWQAAAAAAVLVAGGIGWQIASGEGGGGLPSAIHLAVLPPEPLPDAPETRDFAEGLAETLVSGIVELGADHVDVMPMSEMRAEQVASARQAGARLGANLALTGSLRRAGDRLTLTLDLITTGDRPRVLASTPLTFTDRETHTIRERALRAIASMLGVEITATEADRLASGTEDPDAEEFLRMGVKFLERNRDAEDLDQAIGLIGQAIEEDPAFAEAHARLGEAYLAKYGATRDSSFVARARTAVEEAERLDPEAPAVHVTLSRLHLATGQTALAIAHARRALRLVPSSLQATLALAAAQEAGGDVEAAEATLRGLVERSPASWLGPLHLGKHLFRQARYAQAAEVLERTTTLAPENFQGHLALGGARLLSQDTVRAVAAFEAAARLRRDHYGAITNLGTIHLGADRPDEAVRWYRRAVDLDTTREAAWRNLASAYSALDDEPRRRAALRGALRRVEADLDVNPNDPGALAAAATYRLELDDRQGAVEAARRAAALAPSDPAVQVEAAAVLAGGGDPEAAADLLEALGRAGYPLDGMDAYGALAPLADDPRIAALR